MAHALFILISLTWGASFILMKISGGSFGPLAIGGGRCLTGALVLLTVWAGRDRKWHLRRRHLLPFAILVATGYLWPYTMQPYFIGCFDSAFVGQIIAFVPLFTIFVSIPLLKTYPTRRQLVGVLIGLGCYAVLLVEGMRRDFDLPRVLFLLTVPLSYAIGNTVNKRYLDDVPPLFLAGAALVCGSIIILPLAAARETVVPGDGFSKALAALLTLGIVGTGAAMAMFYRLIHDHGPLYAGMVTYLIPIGSLLWGSAAQESITALQIIAVTGTLIGVAVAQSQRRPPLAGQ